MRRMVRHMQPTTGVDISTAPVSALLALYARILTELMARGVVRTRNAPAGDLAEVLVARTYGGELAANSEKSWDVAAPDGRRIQVKCRVIQAKKRSHSYSPFRSFDFDACVFVLLDADTYEVLAAVEVPASSVQSACKPVAWVGGHRMAVGRNLLALAGAVDQTRPVRVALAQLDREAHREPSSAVESMAEHLTEGDLFDPEPVGLCYCGCGSAVGPSKYFVPSHDRKAESRVIRERYGSIAGFVAAHDGTPKP